ncbi:MAG: hypothetical protein HYX25_03055 [Candidatus Solibacter usitatus]|nr:hypothetical protein [Candidatus Solibacter usitatus]
MTGAAWLLGLTLTASACTLHREKPRLTEEEPSPRPAMIVRVADPATASQLLSGFYEVEHDAWRWTAGRFSVRLRPPREAARKGATLQLKCSVPEIAIAKLKTISLGATLNGTALGRETYRQAGEFTYSREVAARLLTQEPAQVDFSLDKVLPAAPGDKRTLGIIVISVGFEPK